MNKKWFVLLLPTLLVGCATSTESNNATTGGYYQETGSELVFESLDQVFESESTVSQPDEAQVVESRSRILAEGGYTELEMAELEEKGVDLSILEESVVGFGFDSYKLDDESKKLIEKHVQLLNELPQLKVILEGHTDSRGDRGYNLKLGENRAIAVKDLMVSKYAIQPERIEVISFGKEKLLNKANSEEAHRENRRAEFRYQ